MPPDRRACKSAVNPLNSLSERSATKITCRCSRNSISIVLRSSANVPFLPKQNCKSSMTSTSTSRYLRRKLAKPPPRALSVNSMVNCSPVNVKTRRSLCIDRKRCARPMAKCDLPDPCGPCRNSGLIWPGRSSTIEAAV